MTLQEENGEGLGKDRGEGGGGDANVTLLRFHIAGCLVRRHLGRSTVISAHQTLSQLHSK